MPCFKEKEDVSYCEESCSDERAQILILLSYIHCSGTEGGECWGQADWRGLTGISRESETVIEVISRSEQGLYILLLPTQGQ